MKTLSYIFVSVLVLSLALNQVHATEKQPGIGAASDYQDKLEQAISKGVVDSTSAHSAGSDPARPEQPPASLQDAETLERYHLSLRAYYDYRASGLEHRSAVFKWQLFSAKLIFCIVLLVVGTGIVLAIRQFQAELKRLEEGKSDAMPATELEASQSGVKVSSSVIGLIILTLSLAFFYLYLVHVFPIEDIF